MSFPKYFSSLIFTSIFNCLQCFLEVKLYVCVCVCVGGGGGGGGGGPRQQCLCLKKRGDFIDPLANYPSHVCSPHAFSQSLRE